MINLFIDTNRYLNLYGFPKKELEEIKKIISLIKDKKIILWLPEQVKHEFYRRREERLMVYYEKFERIFSIKTEKDTNIPEIDASKIVKMIEESHKPIDEMIQKARGEFLGKIKNNSFLADELIQSLFSLAKFVPYDEEIIKKATTRFQLGNPPGKNGSYGDAVIWETLLGKMPEEDLHFVGFDKDFKAKSNDLDFSPYLLNEWKQKKKSIVLPFKHLGGFVREKVPNIENSEQIVKQEEKIDKEISSYKSPFQDYLAGIALNLEAIGKMVSPVNSFYESIAKQNEMIYKSLVLPSVDILGLAGLTSRLEDKSEKEKGGKK